MSFEIPSYHAPDFTQEKFCNAPDVRWAPAPKDGVAPEHYHSTSMYPEYFKLEGVWTLAKESRMDASVVIGAEGELLVVENRDFIDNITFNLYPQLAARFNTTPSRIERGIRHAIELTWTRGNLDVITHYFGNNINADKGKPTNGEFLARTANIVKLRMREAA